jgi:uncharacterized protein YhaN
MEIRELYLKNFGKFSDRRFLINKGIHVFYGENEYGKSTIYAFIKAMLFGFERGRGELSQNDEFSQYEPWEDPSYYAGVIRFTSGEKTYRLERQFDKNSERASLVCEDDDAVLSLEDGDLDALLGQVTSEDFENTAAIGQLKAKPGQGLSEGLKNYAANYYETGSSTVDLSGALDALMLRKKSVEQEIKELELYKEQKINAIVQETQYVSSEIDKLKKELTEKEGKLESFESDNNRENAEKFKSEDRNLYRSLIITGLYGILSGFAGQVWNIITASWKGIFGRNIIFGVSWVLLVVGVILIIAGVRKYRDYRNRLSETENEADAEVQPVERRGKGKEKKKSDEPDYIHKLQWENQRIEDECKERQIKLDNLKEEQEELEAPTDKMKNLQVTQQALVLAEETLTDTSRSMVEGFGTLLNQKASQIMEQITDGRYTKLLIDDQLNMVLFENERSVSVNRVSCGTMEQVYFALRMAVMDLMFEEPLPIILDEAFVYYDEDRLRSVLKWLKEQQRQVILFTCQKREQDVLKRL